MLLNRVLTVRPGRPNSHRGKGWEEVTECAIDALAARGGPLVGDPLGPRRPEPASRRLGAVPAVESVHPSPLSAQHGGFFGSRPFSRVNALLDASRAPRSRLVDWTPSGIKLNVQLLMLT